MRIEEGQDFVSVGFYVLDEMQNPDVQKSMVGISTDFRYRYSCGFIHMQDVKESPVSHEAHINIVWNLVLPALLQHMSD